MEIEENYKWWEENRSKYIEKYKGQYVLISDKKIIASNRSSGVLSIKAKGLEHYLIISVGFTTPTKKSCIGLPSITKKEYDELHRKAH